jgi:hypothetical protein
LGDTGQCGVALRPDVSQMPECSQRCTRLLIPLSHLDLRWRSCYGLSYKSRALNNYKDSVWGVARLRGCS